MKLTSYKKILTMGKAAANTMLAPIRAKQAKQQGELEMMKIDEQLITIESEVQTISAEHPLNFGKLIDRLDKAALLERRKKQFQKVLDELFPED